MKMEMSDQKLQRILTKPCGDMIGYVSEQNLKPIFVRQLRRNVGFEVSI
jgi:hypothetical protein